MPIQIQSGGEFVEVTVSGEVSKWEIMDALGKLRILDPRKERCDLWMLGPEVVIPFAEFASIIGMTMSMATGDFVGNKSAVVASDEFQLAEADMYRMEAKGLPYPIGVFTSRDEAVKWLRSPAG